MLQTLTLSSSVPWDDPLYSKCWAVFTIIVCCMRLLLTLLQKKYYYRPYAVCLFTLSKFLLDYFMFEGVERFSKLPDFMNMRILTGLEVLYVILCNCMIYSIFYGNFAMPSQVIIQFTAATLISIVVAVTMLTMLENQLWHLLMIVGLHIVGFSLFCDKCIGIVKCHQYNSTGVKTICVTMFFHFLFNHFLRVLYLTTLLLNVFNRSLSLDRFLYICQTSFSFLLISFFVLYRLQNTDRITTVLVVTKKTGGVEAMIEGFGPDLIDRKAAAEELMYPGDNDLNTVSERSSIADLEVIMELPEDLCEEDIIPTYRSTPTPTPTPTVFTTEESGRSRRNFMRNKVCSEDGKATGRGSIRTVTP